MNIPGSQAVIHIPHASTVIPADVLGQFVVSRADLAKEIARMTDHLTDQLFETPAALVVRHPVSRLVVDPERFESDADEVMASRGLGVVHSRTSGGQPLRRPLTADERAQLLERWYRPHHAALAAAVQSTLEARGHCLIVDGHSFPARPLPCEQHQDADRPDICIGTDEFHTPPWLRDLAVRLCQRPGWSVSVDRPFSGALVPGPHYRTESRVHAVMIEVNRRLYLDEPSCAPSALFEVCRSRLHAILRALIREADEISSDRP